MEKKYASELKINFDEILEKLANPGNASNEELKNFVDSREKLLDSLTIEKKISFYNGESYADWINSRSQIYKSEWQKHLLIDDDEAYQLLMRNFANTSKEEDFSFENDLPKIIQSTVDEYFGNLPKDFAEQKNLDLFRIVESDPDQKSLSISDLKRSGAALSFEKSALAQNLLAFLEVHSDLMYKKDLQKSSQIENFNLVYISGNAYIFDADVKNNSIDETGASTQIPGWFKLSGEQVQSLLSGQPVDASMTIQVKDIDNKISDHQVTKTYQTIANINHGSN